MTQIKTTELSGAALDWAVATANGDYPQWNAEWGVFYQANGDDMDYSTDWAQGGPIIEREGLNVLRTKNGASLFWVCETYKDETFVQTKADTPLIAAMRCYVASKLGDTVEVPEALK